MIVIPFADILSPGVLKTIRACLRDGGVIAYPTDTLYGLGGNFFSTAVSEKIDRLKKRRGLPYSVAVGNLAMLEALAAEVPAVFRRSLQKLLPGKFTFLFAAAPAIDPVLLKRRDKIGIRIPALPPLLKLIERLGFPLVTTSANRSNEPPLNDPRLIAQKFPQLDLLIDGGALPASAGSTLVDLTIAPPRIVRAGDDAEKFIALMKEK
jgi:tRNA threonylcarbamoyl adenosine modification protein (Sua5/YciO/YrdC/YwlC family)